MRVTAHLFCCQRYRHKCSLRAASYLTKGVNRIKTAGMNGVLQSGQIRHLMQHLSTGGAVAFFQQPEAVEQTSERTTNRNQQMHTQKRRAK